MEYNLWKSNTREDALLPAEQLLNSSYCWCSGSDRLLVQSCHLLNTVKSWFHLIVGSVWRLPWDSQIFAFHLPQTTTVAAKFKWSRHKQHAKQTIMYITQWCKWLNQVKQIQMLFFVFHACSVIIFQVMNKYFFRRPQFSWCCSVITTRGQHHHWLVISPSDPLFTSLD